MTGTVVDAPHRRVTLAEVRAHREEIHRIAEKYGVLNVRVFGSVARDEADDDSDLDLLVDPGPQTSLWGLSGFALDVEELLNVFTQVATPNGLKSRIRDRVLAEAVPL
ncbi:hypothetical protein FHX82_000275 [Amycolatopsis bartoniae]|uniref:Nucleotidyltransferase n=1 Tax=Amycolatopsis bartoniae TaxID=941986 RepID=A0A8H9IVC8_9PSEU|nr:nucleotidyltransferase domain-containing protein [Amycolatopsis bartoniae]MBB2933255.1 hypothetical protein [Amycolatopsis bartoniae]TVT11760.1 DNA polymerase subunit beta [Amycolatopsis bartoniae]GHF58195.1 nucleotidyltransferase [Amycolatopsis bartoniae]